jgi:hypothetical protein
MNMNRDSNPMPRLSSFDYNRGYSVLPDQHRRALPADAPIMPGMASGTGMAATMGHLAAHQSRFDRAFNPQGPGDLVALDHIAEADGAQPAAHIVRAGRDDGQADDRDPINDIWRALRSIEARLDRLEQGKDASS